MPRITRKKGLNEGEADSDSVDELNTTICEQETATAPGQAPVLTPLSSTEARLNAMLKQI